LLTRKVSKRRIVTLLGLPKGMARRYIGNIEARIKQRKLNAALSDMATGDYTAVQAAKRHDVDVADVKSALKGKKKKNEDALKTSMDAIRNAYRGISRRTQEIAKRATEMVLDGQVSPERVDKIFKDLATLRANQTRIQRNAKNRYESAIVLDD
jgi:hypothetical protein